MSYRVVQADSPANLKKFIKFPYKFYNNSETWIAPLVSEQKKLFNPDKNMVLQHCEYGWFLLYRDGQIAGRIAVYLNRQANSFLKESTGYFAYYECVDEQGAAQLLLNTAKNWAKKRGMNCLRGQWNFDTQDIGFTLEGFSLPPVILSSWHWPYYNRQMEACGFKKAKDLLVYNLDLEDGYIFPGRIIKLNRRIKQRYPVTVRTLDKSRLVEETRLVVRLTNEALAGNWGFYPVDESEAEALAKELEFILHPEAVIFAEVDNRPVGYILVLPDVNIILKNLKGKLFPFGMVKLLMNVKGINRYRIWAMGIVKPWQEKGISALMFEKLYESLAHKKPYLEINWVLEDNMIMNNTVHQLKFNPVKKYRIYESAL